MSTLLDKSGLLAAMAAQTVDVPLPSGLVRIRSITAADRIMLGQKAQGADGKLDTVQYSGALVAACVVDEAGQRLFTDDEIGQIMAGSAAVFEQLYDAAQTINGMGAKGQEQAKGN